MLFATDSLRDTSQDTKRQESNRNSNLGTYHGIIALFQEPSTVGLPKDVTTGVYTRF